MTVLQVFRPNFVVCRGPAAVEAFTCVSDDECCVFIVLRTGLVLVLMVVVVFLAVTDDPGLLGQ